MSLSGQTDLLKLYARQAKLKHKSICGQLRDYVTETVQNVCLDKNDEGFVYVIIDTTNPQNRILHDVLHIFKQVGFPRQFEASRLITLHSRRGENKPIYILHVTESFLLTSDLTSSLRLNVHGRIPSTVF